MRFLEVHSKIRMNEQYKSYFRNIPDGVLIVNSMKRFKMLNYQFTDILDVPTTI